MCLSWLHQQETFNLLKVVLPYAWSLIYPFFKLCKIDEDVINCAIKYLRGICGNALDNLSGEHHKVCCTTGWA